MVRISKDINRDIIDNYDEAIPLDLGAPIVPGKVVRTNTSPRVVPSGKYNWTELRKAYVLGNRKQLPDGTFVSEDVSLTEIAKRYGAEPSYIRKRAAQEGWRDVRKAYLARVNQLTTGKELSLYTEEAYQSERATANISHKLGAILDLYIESEFGELLDIVGNVEEQEISEVMKEKMGAVNRNTGVPVFITILKESVKVASDIYKLQVEVQKNAPEPDVNELAASVKKDKKKEFKNDKARVNKIAELTARLSSVLKPTEEVTVISDTENTEMEIFTGDVLETAAEEIL
jgi:hypothetical protein